MLHIKKGFFYSMGHLQNQLTRQQAKELKHELLNNGDYYKYKDLRHQLNKIKPKYRVDTLDEHTGEITQVLEYDYFNIETQKYIELSNDIGSINLHQCQKIDHNKYKRTTRLRNRVSSLIKSGQAYFITLTFRDDVLESTSEDTRRQFVRRFLKQYSSEYVANIDYGKTTEREHYHAITNCNIEKWPYGFSLSKAIAPNLESETKLPMYITKLTHHALKKTVRGSSLIYSRKKALGIT